MKIKNLTIQNFLAIESARLDLEDKGLLLIQGVNNDDPSALSNGSGKSSILDAICWCLYGSTARGITADGVVNEVAGKGCVVELLLLDGATSYVVTRFRKHHIEGNKVRVSKFAGIAVPGADITAGTDKLTQAVIDKIIGCSLDVFLASVYSSQERMVDLPACTDKELKVIVEEAAGVTVLEEAYAKARTKKLAAGADLAQAQRDALVVSEALNEHKNDLRRFASAKYEEDDRNAKENVRLANDLLALDSDLMKLGVDLVALNEKRVTEDLENVNALLRETTSKNKEAESINSLIVEAKVKVSKNEARAEELSRLRADLGKSTESELVCATCGSPLSQEKLDELNAKKSEKIGKIDVAVKELNERKIVLEAELRSLDQQKGKIESDRSKDVSSIMAKQKTLLNDVNAIAKLKTSIEIIESRIRTTKKNIEELSVKKNPYAELVLEKESKIKTTEEKLKTLDEKCKAREKEFNVLEECCEVFGPTGVRAHILDTVTPYLNERTAYYLNALSDGNITALWTTLVKDSKGEVKERFSIEVTNAHGASSYAGLSGGEKRKVKLASAMALQDLVATRATKPISLAMMDEVDAALDESGIERLMNVFNEKAKEKGTVLIVSHTDMKDWCSDTITVTKTGKKSVVEQMV